MVGMVYGDDMGIVQLGMTPTIINRCDYHGIFGATYGRLCHPSIGTDHLCHVTWQRQLSIFPVNVCWLSLMSVIPNFYWNTSVLLLIILVKNSIGYTKYRHQKQYLFLIYWL